VKRLLRSWFLGATFVLVAVVSSLQQEIGWAAAVTLLGALFLERLNSLASRKLSITPTPTHALDALYKEMKDLADQLTILKNRGSRL
jgi:hypothetical protein